MNQFFNIDLSQLSILNFIGLVLLGVIIYGGLWIFKNYLVLVVVQSPVRRKKVMDKLPALYTLIWILFSLYALYIFIKPFPFLGVVLTLIFIYLGRGYLINLIHGLFFRLKGDIVVGQKIALENYSGIVLNTNTLDLEIQNIEGEIIQIPYGNMAKKEIVKKDFSSDFSSFKFFVLTGHKVTESELKNILILQPWVSSVFPPKVSKGAQSEDNIRYDIIVYALDEKYHSMIENDLKMGLLE